MGKGKERAGPKASGHVKDRIDRIENEVKTSNEIGQV
jgi:hypothetical protein